MRKDGLVELEQADETGEERKVYWILPAGAAELDLWLGRPRLKTKPLCDELFVRLGLLVERDRVAPCRWSSHRAASSRCSWLN